MKYIEELRVRDGSGKFSKREYRNLLVIKELYKQQKYMYKNKVHRVRERIVSSWKYINHRFKERHIV